MVNKIGGGPVFPFLGQTQKPRFEYTCIVYNRSVPAALSAGDPFNIVFKQSRVIELPDIYLQIPLSDMQLTLSWFFITLYGPEEGISSVWAKFNFCLSGDQLSMDLRVPRI